MAGRFFALILAAGFSASSLLAAQNASKMPPDLEGVWNFSTLTPFERPANVGGREFYTREEVEGLEKRVQETGGDENRKRGTTADVERAYNDFWWDRGTRIVKTRRTSLIIDPPDGKIPPLTAAAKERQKERQNANLGHEFDGPENRPLQERCIIWASTGPPMMPTAYNNNVRIVQSPGYVTILIEMIHDARIIPMDGRPHLDASVKQWLGDARGRWEGNTLVVETTNLRDSDQRNGGAFGTTARGRVIERFTRLGPDTMDYHVTVDDPGWYTQSWTASIPMTKVNGPIYEYACHEGNYALPGILAGQRREEREAAQKR